MENELKKQMLKSIDITRESTRNQMQISIENYTEILLRLDLFSFLLMREEIK